jgi:hypothetical protein
MINDLIDELGHDLAAIQSQWNNKIVPLTATVPDGTGIGADLNAFEDGLGGNTLYVVPTATVQTSTEYFNVDNNRPNTIFEQLTDVYTEIATLREDIENSIADQSVAAIDVFVKDSQSLLVAENVEDALAELASQITNLGNGTSGTGSLGELAVFDNLGVANGEPDLTFSASLLNVNGDTLAEVVRASSYLDLVEQGSSPTNIANRGLLYTKTDQKLYYLDSTGMEFDLTTSGGGTVGPGTTTELAFFNSSNTVTSASGVTYSGVIFSTSSAISFRPLGAGTNSIKIGTSANAADTNSIAIGNSAVALIAGDIVIGDSSYTTSNSSESVVIGSRSYSDSWFCNVIGQDAYASGLAATAIGNNARGIGDTSSALGCDSIASGSGSVAIGPAHAYGSGSIAIGNTGKAHDDSSIAIGQNAVASGTRTVVIGKNAFTTHTESIAIGYQVENSGADNTVIGAYAWTETGVTQATVLGYTSYVDEGNSAIAIGDSAYVELNNSSIAIGEGANTVCNIAGSYSNIAIGTNASVVGSNATKVGSIAIGAGATTSGTNTITIGSGVWSRNNNDIVLGTNAYTVAGGGDSIVIGQQAVSFLTYSIAAGYQTVSSGIYAIALGHKAESLDQSCIAIGRDASANGNTSISIGDGTKVTANNGIALGGSAKCYKSTALAIGQAAMVSGNASISIGNGAQVFMNTGLAIGYAVMSRADNDILVGPYCETDSDCSYCSIFGYNNAIINNSDYCTVIGADSWISDNQYSIAFGYNATVDDLGTGTGNISIGYNAAVTGSGITSAVALGNTAVAGHSSSVALGPSATTTAANQFKVGSSGTTLNTVIHGYVGIHETTTPTVLSGFGQLYPKTDGNLYFQNDSSVETCLTLAQPVYTITAVKTAGYAANINEFVRCDNTGGGFTITLPASTSANAGKSVIVKNTTSGVNLITVSGQSGELIDGSATALLTSAFEALTFISYNGAWGVI